MSEIKEIWLEYGDPKPQIIVKLGKNETINARTRIYPRDIQVKLTRKYRGPSYGEIFIEGDAMELYELYNEDLMKIIRIGMKTMEKMITIWRLENVTWSAWGSSTLPTTGKLRGYAEKIMIEGMVKL